MLRALLVGAGLCAALVFASCTTLTDVAARNFFLPKDDRPALYDVRTLQDQGFTTSDGVRLNATVHRPRGGPAKTPTILSRIPYNDDLWNRLRSDAIARYWAARGYTVVVQGTRGRFHSGGAFEPMVHERQDGIETLRWIAQQPWYDGHIGMWGGSAFGHTVWAVYDNAEPDVDAAFVQIASTSFERVFHPGGAFALETALYWALLSHGEKDVEVDYEALDRGARAWPAAQADNQAWGQIDFFDHWAGRDPAYWRVVDGEQRTRTARAPMLLLGGWYDPFLPTMLRDYAELKNNPRATGTKLIIGPYGHAKGIDIFGEPGPDYRIASVDPALRWFDAQFGVGSPQPLAPVRIFVMGENVWRDEQEWPLARAVETTLYFLPDGRLGDAPPREETQMRFTYDPRNPVPTRGGAMLGARSGMMRQDDAPRPDVLSFTGAPLAAPMEITGPLTVILRLDTDAATTDFTAKLCVVMPDGSAWNIADGVVRGGFGHGAMVGVDLGATSILLPAGSRLRVDVSSSNFPRIDRNPNTYDPVRSDADVRVAHNVVFAHPTEPSRLVLPVIPR
jgi:putative CocE/NonD family hydrolase